MPGTRSSAYCRGVSWWGEGSIQGDAGDTAMWSQFFVERYAHEKHEAHLSEAAHDRLPRDLRANGHPSQGRLLHVPTAETGGAVVLLVLATLLSVGLTGAVERPTTPARVVEVSAVRPVA